MLLTFFFFDFLSLEGPDCFVWSDDVLVLFDATDKSSELATDPTCDIDLLDCGIFSSSAVTFVTEDTAVVDVAFVVLVAAPFEEFILVILVILKKHTCIEAFREIYMYKSAAKFRIVSVHTINHQGNGFRWLTSVFFAFSPSCFPSPFTELKEGESLICKTMCKIYR